MFDGDAVAQEHIEARLMASAPLILEVGINTVLTTPQVYEGKPPQAGVLGDDPATGYPPPYVVYYNQTNGSTPLLAQNEDPDAALVWYSALWTILVVGPLADEARVNRAKDAILEALQGSEGLVPSGAGYVLMCNLTSTVWLPAQAVEGVDYIRRGYTFRIAVQPSID